MGVRPLFPLLLAAAVACSQATSSPTPGPISPSKGLLFAVLEPRGAITESVTLVGLDGLERASTTFKPAVFRPRITCLGTTLPPTAFVAAGEVFFLDGNGLIRSLTTTGQVKTVTSLSLSSHQMVSFAVSPDGSHLVASILTVPPVTASGAVCGSGAHYSGSFSLDIFSAANGGRPQLLKHQTLQEDQFHRACILEFVGWNLLGPIATYPTCLVAGGGPVHYFGPVVRVDAATGQTLEQIADPQSCPVEDIAMSGDFVCNPVTPSGAGDVSVRRPDGSEIWRFTAQPNKSLEYAFISPDEKHVVGGAFQPEVVGRDGSDVSLLETRNDWFLFFGWLDSSTVVGNGPKGNLSYVSLKSPASLVDLGFQGQYVGSIGG
jgi:hypothetical protein